MKKIYEDLLYILFDKKEQWISSTILSEYLGVSDRQIRRYINEINTLFPNAIQSSYKGYKISESFCENSIKNMYAADITYNPKERQDFVLHILFSNDSYNIFDFSDELNVSPSTIEKDLRSINNKLSNFDLETQISKGNIKIIGEEINKRNFLSTYFYDDIRFNLKSEVEVLADYYNFSSLFDEVKDVLKKHDIFANDYAISNIVLHIVIMVERLKINNHLKTKIPDDKYKHSNQYIAAKEIMKRLQKKYNFKVNQSEIFQLTLVIDNNTSLLDFSLINKNNIHDFIPLEIITLTQNILDSVSKKYVFEEYTDDFTIKFTLHIYNLLTRYKYNYIIKNPFKNELKTKHAYIYDIAVYVAQLLDDLSSIKINEDEISFIAMHLGGFLQEQIENHNKIRATFVYSKYYDNYKSVLSQIIKNFDHDIIIHQTIPIEDLDRLSDESELILTTDILENYSNSLYVGQFLSHTTKIELEKVIHELKMENENKKIKSFFRKFIKKDLFTLNASFQSKFDVIKYMCRNSSQQGYTENSFVDDVIKREQLSSTDFNYVAIPHALSKETRTTFISVLINDKDIHWGQSNIRLIILIGVNENEIDDFAYMYDSLVDILQDKVNVYSLNASKDYEEFINKLIQFSKD